MALPGNITLISLTGTFAQANGGASQGSVTFTPRYSPIAKDVSADTQITTAAITVALNSLGFFTTNLMASNDTDVQPYEFTYHVTEQVDGVIREYDIFLDANGPASIDISDIIPCSPLGGTFGIISSDGGITPGDGGTDGGVL